MYYITICCLCMFLIRLFSTDMLTFERKYFFVKLWMTLCNMMYGIILICNMFCFRDGADLQRGGCLRDFRNRPNPVRLKIRYYEHVLTVSVISFIINSWTLPEKMIFCFWQVLKHKKNTHRQHSPCAVLVYQ